MSQQEREHFNKLYYGTNMMIKDLCSEGAYQEGTYVIFNLILIQFAAEIVLLSFMTFFAPSRRAPSFMNLISISTDFLRYAPCMRKVKDEYELCATAYKNNMMRMSEQKTTETVATTTSTTSTTPPRIVQLSLMKRQQQSNHSIYVSLETSTASAAKNATSEAIDQGEVQIKTVCWWVEAVNSKR